METATVKGFFTGKQGIVMPTYKEQAYELIKEAIIYQKFKISEIYSQESICQELGISRTPVREALLELQKAGYIRFCRGKGIMILPVTDADAKSILELRIYNERYAARLAAQRAGEADLQKINDILLKVEANLESGDSTLLYKLDQGFHSALCEATSNMWLLKLIDELRENYLRFENRDIFGELEIRQVVLDEHKKIFSEVCRHDADAADLAMKEHLMLTYHRTVSRFSIE